MVISKNSQLGLMLFDLQTMKEYLEDMKSAIEREKTNNAAAISEITALLKENGDDYYLPKTDTISGIEAWEQIRNRLGYNKENVGAEFYTKPHPNPFYYLIMPSVDKCAELIKIKTDFSCSVFNKVKEGEHVYLLGKNEMFRFVKFNGAIRGSYWDRANRIGFEIGLLLVENKYYSPSCYPEQFNRIVRLMTFIELGDTEVIYLEKGRNNGKTKKEGKITNTSDYNVYVVDSSWNKLIIRTDGFAVRGHFRLQPCGANMTDRKLIWIDAFEKHGYKRQPRAKILQ